MDRAKSYSWLLTVVMGVALTSAVKELSTLIATPPGPGVPPIFPALTRFFIFLILSIRWTLETLWYFDRAYISQNPQPPQLGINYFFDFFKALINFLIFVPLALSVTAPTSPATPLSEWLNRILLNGREVSTFIWILILLLTYDVVFFLIKFGLWLITRRRAPLRIHFFWACLNLAMLVFCILVYLLWAFLGKPSEGAEKAIFFIILIMSTLSLGATVIEDSPTSARLSPNKHQ
ncbi:MAG TPA: hypothetical protein VGC87_08505 [Pyrinomonadaceae bacterium]|jgi:hypothetical protein